jgi:tetratricopeptide (TPR) repeat protein
MPSPLSVAPPVAPLISAPATSPAGPDSAAAVHLLSLIDDKELAVADWARRGAAVVSHDGDAACLTLPYAAPEEYDLAVEFSRLTGDGDVLAEFPVGKGTCDFVVGGDNNQHAWLGRIAHKWSEGNPTLTDVSVSKNQRHRMEVKVRRNGVEGYLDGKRLCHWRTNGNDMESHKSYLPHNPALMAIGSRRNAVAFYSVEVATPQNADPTSTPHSAEPAAVVLRLTAQRAGRRLSFQLGGEPPVAFEDVFATPPAPASVVAVLGRRVNVRELRAWRQTPPHVPSLMERGDGLYEAKDFTAALAEYQGQMNSAMSKDRHEAAFKGAVCLAALHRDDEAESEFEKLVATGGDDWTVQAGCQLWLLDLNHGRYTEAEGLFERLLPAGFDFSRLATLVPSDVRDPILKHYELAAGSANFLFLDRKKIEDLERLVAVEDLLNAYLVGLTSRVSLVHAYELTGRPELALKVAREAVRSDPLASVPSVALCEEVATLLRHSGQPGNALNRLNDWIAHAPAGRFGDLRHLLLIERAKTHLALNQEAEAERDLKAFFDAADSGDINAMAYRFWGPACLLQGFILSDRGDEAGAREAWRKGVIKADGTGHANALDTLNNLEAVMGSTTASACASMLGGLSGEWSDADGDVYMHLMLQRVSAGQQMLSPLLAGLHAPASSIYQPWKTAQGRDVARRFALGRMDRHESAVAMHALILADILGRSTGGEFTSDEQGLYDAFAADLIERIASQRLSTTQMVQLAASWKGISGMLGWGGLQGSLDPELRAPLAYAMGRRYTTLGHASQAKAFFKLAASDAKPGSMTQKLADRRAQAGTANSPAQ